MELTSYATPRRWQVDNPSPSGATIEIAGWDFGGEGPLALLHHANGMCAATWGLVARALTRDYRVVAIDARGHGDSAHLSVPEDYSWEYFVSDLSQVARQLLAETGESSVALGLGSSFGGIVTAGSEAAHSGLYQRVVMLDPPIHPTADLVEALGLTMVAEPGSRREQLVAQTLRRRSVWSSRNEARNAWADKPLFAPWHGAAFDLYINEGMGDQPDGSVALKCPPEVEAHIFQTTGSLGVLDYAPRVDVPVLLVHAATGFFPEEFFRLITTLFPQGEFAQIDGGHMLPLEVPDLVVARLREWIGLAH